MYAVGDNVPGGAQLHAVLTDHVLLDRNGHLESLALPRQISAEMPRRRSLYAAPVAPVIDRMRELVSRDPGIIGDIMRPQPVFAGGRQQGFRVYPGRDAEAFLRLGLRPGDLVTAIDGTPLDDPARGEQILRTLGNSSEAHVTVMRNGQQQDLTLDLAGCRTGGGIARRAAKWAVRAASAAAAATDAVRAAAGACSRSSGSQSQQRGSSLVKGFRTLACCLARSCRALACSGARSRPCSQARQHHAEFQRRGHHADRRGGRRRDRQELHHRPAGARAGDDVLLDADVAGGLLPGVPRRSSGLRLHRRAGRTTW